MKKDGKFEMSSMIKRINRKIPNTLRTRKNVAKILSFLLYLGKRYDREFSMQLDEALELYDSSYSGDKRRLIKDMIYEYVSVQIAPMEYALFQFQSRTELQKQEYLSVIELKQIFKSKDNNIFPDNKYERYELFSAFFGRKIIHILFNNTEEEDVIYKDFCSENAIFMAKTIRGTKGKGIHRISATEAPDLASLYEIIGGECILEELIIQGEELAKFHPSSVNTIRFVTGMNRRGEFEYLYALLRVGKGGSIVDNVGSGGLVAMIDIETGVVSTDGLYGGRYFECHPDTGIRFKGEQIPLWSELKELAYKMHTSLPNQRLIGFDFAWTTQGWDVVEVNPSPAFASYQILMGEGIRPLLKEKELI